MAITLRLFAYQRPGKSQSDSRIYHPEGRGETATILRTASDYLIQGRAQDAIALLTPEILDSEYSEEAEWLLLCAYLHTNDREKAKVTAESIIRKDGAYTAEATAILKELKEKKLF